MRYEIKKGYIYAGKTGTSQIRKITAEERELKLKNEDLPYEKRDHALFTAFAPYKYPRSVIFVKSLPKTKTGKIQRFLLKKNIKKEFDSPAEEHPIIKAARERFGK